MTTVAVCMARDEADVIGSTVAHMLAQVDAVIVADNLSTDRTREILDEMASAHPGRLVVVEDPDPAYRQSEKMTALALRARLDFGAEWIVPFDADEVWYSPSVGSPTSSTTSRRSGSSRRRRSSITSPPPRTTRSSSTPSAASASAGASETLSRRSAAGGAPTS